MKSAGENGGKNHDFQNFRAEKLKLLFKLRCEPIRITFAYLSPLNNLINLLPVLAKTVIARFWITFGIGCVDGSAAARSRKTLPQWTGAQPTHGLHIRARQIFC